jgi:hypothetical protein
MAISPPHKTSFEEKTIPIELPLKRKDDNETKKNEESQAKIKKECNINFEIYKEEKSPVAKIPDELLKIIRENIETSLNVLDDKDWERDSDSFYCQMMGKDGQLLELTKKPLSGAEESDFIVPLCFTYGIEKVSLNFNELQNHLRKVEKGLSITVAKIYLTMEKIFSQCYSVHCKMEGEVMEKRGKLNKEKLKELLSEKGKIEEIWDIVNDPKKMRKEVEGLLEIQYENHLLDTAWNPNWSNKNLNEGQILIIKRKDRCYRFCSVHELEFTKSGQIEKKMRVQVNLESKEKGKIDTKEIDLKNLSNAIKYIW